MQPYKPRMELRLAEQARTTGEAEDALGSLPVWDLSDLYQGMDSPQVKADLERSEQLSVAFEERYKGKLAELASAPGGGAELAEAVAAFERIEELMGRLASFAGLVYSGDTSDP